MSPAAPACQAHDAYLPRVGTVRARRREIAEVTTLEVEVPGLGDAGAPGQFAMLYAFGVGEAAISFGGLPDTPGRFEFTIRNAGATTAALSVLEPGDRLGVRGPYGVGWPMQAAADRTLIVMAGGLGLAPLRPVLQRALSANRDRPERTILLLGARSPDQIVYPGELEAWARAGLHVHVTVDTSGPEWTGDVGLVTALVARLEIDPDKAVAFICGPEVMMRFSADALVDRGLSTDRVWLSMERNMKCAIARCGHCQFGPDFVCKDGPVFRFDAIRRNLFIREL